jgi:hypothetical protein
MKQKDFNTIYMQGKKVFDKLNYDTLERLINSDFTPYLQSPNSIL